MKTRVSTRLIALGLPICLATMALIGCGSSSSTSSDQPAERTQVLVVNEPLRYFADRLGGEAGIEVVFPAPRGIDPSFWHPAETSIAKYQQAKLILLNGADYAHWTSHSTLPTSRIRSTLAGHEDRVIQIEGGVSHRHGPDGEHEHGAAAVHTWLDPDLALIQARAVYDALVESYPEHRASLDLQWQALEADLQQWKQALQAALAAAGDRPLLASHPVYHYLVRFGNLNLENLHWEPQELPAADEWLKFDQLREQHAAGIMLWEGEPDATIRAELEQREVEIVVVIPAGNRVDGSSWLEVMQANTERLATALNRGAAAEPSDDAGENAGPPTATSSDR